MLLYIILILIVLALVFLFWHFYLTKKEVSNSLDSFSQKIDSYFLPQIGDLRKELNERLKENRESLERTTQMLVSFSSGITKVDSMLNQLKESVDNVTSFQEYFRTPKLRGRWGEVTLENLLSQVLSVNQFQAQYSFKSGEVVDAVVKLPNGKLLPIDAKFPYDFFEKMIEEKNPQEKEKLRKSFIISVKKEIDDISRKYVLPSENTLDYALMYLPAEVVYYEISNQIKEENLNEYARKKKVVMVSPSMLFAFLRIILLANRDYKIAKQIQEISKKLERIIIDAQKLTESFSKLGKHLSDSRSAYEESQKRLDFFLERSKKLIELEFKEEDFLAEPEKEDENR